MKENTTFPSNGDDNFHIYEGYEEMFGYGDASNENIDFLIENHVEFINHKYYSLDQPFLFLCAPKGSGKTTIVRLWQNKLQLSDNTISILQYDTDISPSLSNTDWTDSIRKWKVAIVRSVIKAITNINSNLITPDLLPDKNSKLNATTYFNKILKEISLTSKESYKEYNPSTKFWLFIDEVDQHFTRETKNINKIASMLLASRELSTCLTNLNIRVTIKPNVWSVVSSERSSMSNIKAYKIDHKWTSDNVKKLFSRRIEYNLKKRFVDFQKRNSQNVSNYDNWLMCQLFDPKKFDLGKSSRPQHKILATLGIYRPRWILQLSLQASKYSEKNKRITIKNVIKATHESGLDRMQDICSEYSTQSKDINRILRSFTGGKFSFKGTNRILNHIEQNILKKGTVNIAGVSEKCSSIEVLNFLFELGFIEPELPNLKKEEKEKYNFIHFVEDPTFLESVEGELFEKVFWKIHPAFRNKLHVGIPLKEL